MADEKADKCESNVYASQLRGCVVAVLRRKGQFLSADYGRVTSKPEVRVN